jgi:hypothetical protein
MIHPAEGARTRRFTKDHPRESPFKLAAAALAVFATLGLLSTGVLFEGMRLNPRNDCPRSGDPPAVEVVALDTTDQLLRAQPRLVGRVVDQVVSGTAPGDRLAVAEIREGGLEQHLSFNRCVPGRGSNVERNRLRDAVREPISHALQSLAGQPEAGKSPIIEAIIALVDHPELQPTRGHLKINLLTDGLQSSSFASAYTGKSFPAPLKNLLQGVTIRLVVLRNARDLARQRRGVEMLLAWMRGCGARVEYDPFAWERFEGEGR